MPYRCTIQIIGLSFDQIFTFTTLNHSFISPLSGVVSSPILGKCKTSQSLLAGVSGVFFPRDSPVFAPPTDLLVSYELK